MIRLTFGRVGVRSGRTDDEEPERIVEDRTRAFIVALGLFDIEATKIGLYDNDGVPVRAPASTTSCRVGR